MSTLTQDIKSGDFRRVYLLYGNETYLKRSYKDRLTKAVCGKETMNLDVFEGKDVDPSDVIDSADTVPFFATYRMIVLENTGWFKSGKKAIEEYIAHIPKTTVMLFVEDYADKRSRLYKTVNTIGTAVELNTQKEEDVAVWALGVLKKNGKKITRLDMSYLIAGVGTDMETLSNELDKLISYTLGRDVITHMDIDAVCTKKLDVKIFDMMDAISLKNQRKTLECYYALIEEKEPPMRILYMLCRQFNLLLQAKDFASRGMSSGEAASAMGVQGFIAKKCLNQSKNFTAQDLKKGLAEGVETEELIKAGRMDESVGLETLLVKYSRS